MFKQFIVFAFFFYSSWAAPEGQSQKNEDHDCDSDIFCYGDLLETIQLSKVYDDSETFVNMKMLHSPGEVRKNFNELKDKKKDLKEDVDALRNFLDENFDKDPLLSVDRLPDYGEMVNLKQFISDPIYLEFYRLINPTWEGLGATTDNEIIGKNPDRHTMLQLPKYFIKTGDSQSLPEAWQNYLIVRGLLWNDMFQSALNIIKNMAHLLKTRDFVPLTNRTYAEKRHQLPLLAFMVDDYLQAYYAANNIYDSVLFNEMYPLVEKELAWWTDNAKAGLKIDDKSDEQYKLYKYTSAYGHEPRPDNYKEDHSLADGLPSKEEKTKFYSEVRALDQTATGYSSRFLQNKKYDKPRSNLEVSRFAPVELNSVLLRCAEILIQWFKRVGKTAEKEKYEKLAGEIQQAMDKFLWSKEYKIWLDYDLQTGEHVDSYYITNMLPAFTSSYNDEPNYDSASTVLNYLIRKKIISDSDYDFKYHAIPTSNNQSGEISDEPYGSVFWNLFIIEGLRESKNKDAKQVARKMAAALVKTIYDEYGRYETLFENYRVDKLIEKDEAEKLNKSSTSTLGGLITLLRWYGLEIKYNGGVGRVPDQSVPVSASDMSISESDADFSFQKRPLGDTSTPVNEVDPDMVVPDTSQDKKRIKKEDVTQV